MSDTLSELDSNFNVIKNQDGKIVDFIKLGHTFDPQKKEDLIQLFMTTDQGENKIKITLLDKTEEQHLIIEQEISRVEIFSLSKHQLVKLLEEITYKLFTVVQKQHHSPKCTFEMPNDFIQKVCSIKDTGFHKKTNDSLSGLSIAAMVENQKKPKEVFVQPTRVTDEVVKVEMTPEEEVRVLEAASKFFSED
jgi:hypothetical protein